MNAPLFIPTELDILRDLRPLTHDECAVRGIRHSSEDDHSLAVLDSDSDALLLGMLGHSARKHLTKKED